MPRERGSLCASRCDVDRPRFCPARGLTLAEWGFSTINELKSLLKKISIFLGESHSALLDPLGPAFRSRSFEGLGVAEAFFSSSFLRFSSALPTCSYLLQYSWYTAMPPNKPKQPVLPLQLLKELGATGMGEKKTYTHFAETCILTIHAYRAKHKTRQRAG